MAAEGYKGRFLHYTNFRNTMIVLTCFLNLYSYHVLESGLQTPFQFLVLSAAHSVGGDTHLSQVDDISFSHVLREGDT